MEFILGIIAGAIARGFFGSAVVFTMPEYAFPWFYPLILSTLTFFVYTLMMISVTLFFFVRRVNWKRYTHSFFNFIDRSARILVVR